MSLAAPFLGTIASASSSLTPPPARRVAASAASDAPSSSSSSASSSTSTASPSSSSSSADGARTLGWGRRRGAIAPDDALLNDPSTHGYCVYSHADWSHAYASATGEHDELIASSAIEGAIPPELLGGVLYRNGPGLFERGGKAYAHMLDGDGYVCRFEFRDDGSCAFISRFVRTEEFEAEDAENAVTYRGTFGTMRDGGPLRNAFDLHQKNLANTNVLAWGGRVYALYEAGRPVELDPATLRAKGEKDLDGKLPKGMFISGAFHTLVPIRPRRRGARRSLRTWPVVSFRPHLAFNTRPRHFSTPTDALQLHPDVASRGPTLSRRAERDRTRARARRRRVHRAPARRPGRR